MSPKNPRKSTRAANKTSAKTTRPGARKAVKGASKTGAPKGKGTGTGKSTGKGRGKGSGKKPAAAKGGGAKGAKARKRETGAGTANPRRKPGARRAKPAVKKAPAKRTTSQPDAAATKRHGAPRQRSLRRSTRQETIRVIPKGMEHDHKRPVKVAPPTGGKKKGKTGKKGGKPSRRKGGTGSPKERTRKTGKRAPLTVAGHKVEKGSSENILLKVSEHYTHQGVYIPVTIIRGARAGPRIYLTAAVHGDEINGVQIIREVIDRIDPGELKGTIVAVPVVNRFGFVSHSRYMPDRRDLNRFFPGEANGNTTARLAHVVFEEIIRQCDYGIDLHTAGYQRHNLPQIRGDMDHDDVRRIAKAFGAEVILDTRGHRGTLRRAATEAGVPTIIYEAGETFRFQRDAISKGVTGILNVMRDLKMLKGKPERPAYQVIVKTSEWVRADHGGIMEVLVDAGDLVFAGEEIAHIANPFGRTVDSVRAPFDGMVVGVTMLPMVNPGAPVCHLVKLKKTLATVAHHHGRVRVDRIEQEDIDEEPALHALEEEDVEG